jgi:hypothetical protein
MEAGGDPRVQVAAARSILVIINGADAIPAANR